MTHLPVNTRIQIKPADLIPKGDGHQRRKWLMSPQRAPVKREEDKPVVVMAPEEPRAKPARPPS